MIDSISADDILNRQDTSYWLKNAIKTALQRDPVDAVKDAELLTEILRQRCEAILRGDLSQI